MKVCVPVEEIQGLESVVYGHFGSAPCFIVADTESGEIKELSNKDLGHAHGACNPMKNLAGQAVEAIVVSGIGGPALNGLKQAGLRVYRFQGGTVKEALTMLKDGGLEELVAGTCGGHAHGKSCGCH